MGQNSSIEWTDHSFNPWHGCVKVSPGCQHCYAETLDRRFGRAVWGPAKTTPRMLMSDNYWKQPLKWDRLAQVSGQRKRVFCASMADVFEAHQQLSAERAKLWDMIEQTPNLDWLLLTKRPENITTMLPRHWLDTPRENVWFGTSVEDQQRADERIPELLRVPAKVRFLSCEPLLGSVTLRRWVRPSLGWGPDPIHWVIAGGESGPGARPMHPDWARSLRDECQAAGDIAFHFKQWGQFAPPGDYSSGELAFEDGQRMRSIGKHASGRLLDGRTWDQFPE